jgi:hypothetical protein
MISVLMMLACSVRAEVMGVSANGIYVLQKQYYRDAHGPDLFRLDLFDFRRKSHLLALSWDNEVCYEKGWNAFWHPSRSVLALGVFDSRRISHVQIYAFTAGKYRAFKLPDYLGEALAKVGAQGTGNCSIERIQRWEGDRLLIRLEFNVTPGNAGSSAFYTADAILKLRGTKVQLESVSQPVES